MSTRADAGRPLAWVVYESMFGNTQRIARAIAEGLGSGHEVALHEVSKAPDVVTDDVALLVVGGPTHGFTLSTGKSREQAREQAGGRIISVWRGLREWLSGVELLGRPCVAVFDTKVGHPRWFWGSAARRARKELEHKGGVLLRPPESFYVHFKAARLSDLLLPGELERARTWGASLALSSPSREAAGPRPGPSQPSA